jgi:hypothetical protein
VVQGEATANGLVHLGDRADDGLDLLGRGGQALAGRPGAARLMGPAHNQVWAESLAEAEAALKKLMERSDNKRAAEALEKAVQRLKEQMRRRAAKATRPA